MNQETVLIIDDDIVSHKVITRALVEDFDVISAKSGEMGLEMVRSQNPDLIVLDVEMPGMNGYMVCEILKSEPETQDLPVLFMSGHGGLRDRLQGYEAGGDDFLVKPFAPEELRAKLHILSKNRMDRLHLVERAKEAQETALMAMTGSSELGVALQFVEASYVATSYQELADRFFRVTDGFRLQASLLCLTAEGPVFMSSKGTVSPIEQQLMLGLHAEGRRITDFGCRTQINYPRVALLIKNMPLDDRETYGRYKDLFPFMLGAADGKVRNLDAERALVRQTRDLIRSFNVVEKTLTTLSANLKDNQQRVLKIMQALMGALDERIPTLGLEEDQAAFLIGRVDQALRDAYVAMDEGQELRASYENVMRLFKHLTVRQQQIQEIVTAQFENVDQSRVAATSDVSADVELF